MQPASARMQVVSPYTGDALAVAPPLPDLVKHQVWECVHPMRPAAAGCSLCEQGLAHAHADDSTTAADFAAMHCTRLHAHTRFPRMGPQVNLLAPVMRPSAAVRLEFMAFGGSNVDDALAQALRNCSHVGPNRTESEAKPCAEYSVRIGLNISADGTYAFDGDWQVRNTRM